jgi:hypothetical protein
MSLRRFLTVILLITSFSSIARTQQRAVHVEETGLVLEVVYVKSKGPAYQKVRWSDSTTLGDWYSHFGRVAGWQLPSGAKPIRAVRILPQLSRETVTIKVSVLRGQKYHEIEDAVGTYTLQENQKVSVDLLKDFGVEPFEIKVIRLESLPSTLPVIENRTSSVEVVGIEPLLSTLPRYKLTFRNLSQTSIHSLTVKIMQGERTLGTGRPQGSEGRPLMQPGESFEWRLPLATQAEGPADSYSPTVPLDQRVVVAGLVFSDGREEGVPGGMHLQGERYGRKIELRRILPLLESSLATANADLVDGPTGLRLQIEALTFDLTEAEQDDLNKTLTVNENVSKAIELGRHLMRRDILEELQRVPAMTDPQTFKVWLARAKERYSNWLLRLEPDAGSK